MRLDDSETAPASRRVGSSLLGVTIGGGSLADITNRSLRAIARESPQCIFACANPHSLVEAQHDPEFKRALNEASIVVADGVGVSLMARLLRIDVGPRITGQAYFESMMAALAARGAGRVFFFGSSEAVLATITDRCATQFPGLELCGTLSPPFRPISADENGQMVERINRARPDVLWVGMTAPKQEKWVRENAPHLDVPVIGSIGAVFDFFACTKPRAPQWMCALGVEWLYRLAREPRRMWRRTLVSAPGFLRLVVRQHVLHQR